MNPEGYVWDSSVKVWGFVYLTMLILCTLMNSSLSECAGDASFPSTLGALVSLSCCLHGCSVASPAWAILSTQMFFSPACPGQHFLCLILLEIHRTLPVCLDVSPRSEELTDPSKVVSYSLSFLYETLTMHTQWLLVLFPASLASFSFILLFLYFPISFSPLKFWKNWWFFSSLIISSDIYH